MSDTNPPLAPSQAVDGNDVIAEKLPSGTVQIWLNRPDRLNALSVNMVVTLLQAVRDAIDANAAAIVIRGKGRAFCAGADLKERKTMDEAARLAHNRGINDAINALAAAPMPTIAFVNGLALGGGCELALGCDVRFAAASAQIGLTESRIGAIPGAGGTQRLPRLIGISRALEMMYSGEPVSAQRAQDIGLVNACVDDAMLDETAMRYIELIGSRSPRTARMLKSVVNEGFAMPLADGLAGERKALGAIFASADYAEGLAAFAEKRSPNFSR